MNEYIEIAFRTPEGKRLRVARQTADGGIQFDERDPIDRAVGIQINARGAATEERMRRIAQVKGWGLREFRLSATVEGGNLVLRGADPDALPEGLYTLRVEIEEARTRQQHRTVEIDQDGNATAEVVVSRDERDVAVDLTNCDNDIRLVLDQSKIDGQDADTWLQSSAWRPTRKACLLNVLASLRSRPTLSDSLIGRIHHVFRVFNDRAFMRVDRSLVPHLEELAAHPSLPFYREGKPLAKVHQRLLDDIQESPVVKAKFRGLLSFRGEGKPSLQVVVAVPPVDLPYSYAEFDLDLGNPLQDVLGFIVHVGELLDGKPTNHLDLRKRLVKTKAKDFLYYSVVSPA